MTSAIVSSSIDETYPVAGVDNNSQGFRDNFSAIKTGLATAASEITTLQTGSAKLTQDNDFGGHAVANAVYNKFHGAVYINAGTISANLQPVSINNGPLQIYTIGSATTLTFVLQDWPATRNYAKVRLHLFSDQNGSKTVNFGTVNAGVVKPEITSPTPWPLVIPADGNHRVVELWTYNGGSTVFLKLIGTY